MRWYRMCGKPSPTSRKEHAITPRRFLAAFPSDIATVAMVECGHPRRDRTIG